MAITASPLTTIYTSNLTASRNYCHKIRCSKLSSHGVIRVRDQRISRRWPPEFHLRASVPIGKAVAGNSSNSVITSAYVSGPAFDAIVSEKDEFKAEDSPEHEDLEPEPSYVISWGLLWRLVSQHKLRLLISTLTLFGCTTCTLSMPLLSGRFFEVLVGRRTDSMFMLLSKIGILYTLEPVCTVIFIVNMNAIWEKVMSSLRAQIFQRVLIQKVEFFDRYKVGELTALLTSDLGSLKNIVSENVSRDRGFRALSEVVGTICLLFVLSPQLAPILGLLMLTISTFVGKNF